MDDPNGLKKPKRSQVGYGRPPEHSRFKRGQSGNLSGRPRGTLSIGAVLERTLRERVIINDRGKRRSLSKLEAAVKQLVDQAAAGDLKALQLLSTLLRSAEERQIQNQAHSQTIDIVDVRVIRGILARLNASNAGEENENADR
jgi:hypothetical protein